jgi:hypothetical protein
MERRSKRSRHTGANCDTSQVPYGSQSTRMELIHTIARGGKEDPHTLWNTFGNAPIFSMTDHALYNEFMMHFVDVLINTCVRVLNQQVGIHQTLLEDKVLCNAWVDRIEVWIRRFYVKNAVSIKAHLPSLPEALVLSSLFLAQVKDQSKATHANLSDWVTHNRLAKLQEHFPTIKQFYAEVRALSSISSCNRWRCQYGGLHMHAAAQQDDDGVSPATTPATTSATATNTTPAPSDAIMPSKSVVQPHHPLTSVSHSSHTGMTTVAPSINADGGIVHPPTTTTTTELTYTAAKDDVHPGTHPGVGFETHLRMWQRTFARLVRMSRQLLCQASTDLQFGDVWVEDALALRTMTEGASGPQHLLTMDNNQTASVRASGLLVDQAARLQAEQERRKAQRLKWLGRTASAVGGNINQNEEGKSMDVELAPNDENDRKVSMRNGSTVRDKKRTVLSTATRVYYWCSVNLRAVTSRTCLVVPQNALQRATKQVRRALDCIMEIEPGSDEQVCLTKMIYQTAMGVSMREVFLQTHRSRTPATNPITVMNRSLSPIHITQIQAAFMGRKLRDLYADPTFPYHDILDLCLWSYHMHIRTRIDWLQDYCLYGDGFQDKIQRAFEPSVMCRARTPMVALVAGQWCVLEGTDCLYLCRTTLEACTLWMLLVWTRHGGNTDTRMSIEAALRWSFERDDKATTLSWLTEKRKQDWSVRLDKKQNHIVWKRPPGPIAV